MNSGAESLRGVTLVLGTSAGGTGAHVRMVAAGLSQRGVAVSVAGPLSADTRFSFSALPSVSFSDVEISDRPRVADLARVLRLRKLLLRGSPGGGHAVHAHGMRAGAFTVVALMLVRRGRPRVVVTVHNAPPPGRGVGALVYRLLERVVARWADLVLCVSPDLEVRMRAAGARRVERAVIAAPGAAQEPAVAPLVSDMPASGASAGEAAAGRPVVLAAGRLAAQKGFGVLLEAAASWRDLEPMPLVVIAGDGPLKRELRARAAVLRAAAVFLGQTR